MRGVVGSFALFLVLLVACLLVVVVVVVATCTYKKAVVAVGQQPNDGEPSTQFMVGVGTFCLNLCSFGKILHSPQWAAQSWSFSVLYG